MWVHRFEETLTEIERNPSRSVRLKKSGGLAGPMSNKSLAVTLSQSFDFRRMSSRISILPSPCKWIAMSKARRARWDEEV